MPGISFILLGLLAQSDMIERGVLEFHRGEYAAAKKHLEQTSGPRGRAFLALSQAATGECDAATSELRRGFAGNTDRNLRRLAGLALTQCLAAAGQFSAAEPVIAALQKEFPTDADVLYVSADLHMKAWNDAVYRMYRNTPASYRVNQLSAGVFETQGKYREAIAEYTQAIGKNPKAIDLHYRLGRAILLDSHEPAALDRARKEFEAELVLNPSDAAAEYQVGQILIAQSKKREAGLHFERAMDLRPDFGEALIAVGKIRTDEKRYDDAVELFQRAIKLQPRSEVARYNLMIAYRNAGKRADAEREKAQLEKLQKPPDGEFADFLKRLGAKAPPP